MSAPTIFDAHASWEEGAGGNRWLTARAPDGTLLGEAYHDATTPEGRDRIWGLLARDHARERDLYRAFACGEGGRPAVMAEARGPEAAREMCEGLLAGMCDGLGFRLVVDGGGE